METREDKIKYLFNGQKPLKFYYVDSVYRTENFVSYPTDELDIYIVEVQGVFVKGTLQDGEIEILYNNKHYNLDMLWTSIDSAIFQYVLRTKLAFTEQIRIAESNLKLTLKSVSKFCKSRNYKIGERVDNYIKTGVF